LASLVFCGVGVWSSAMAAQSLSEYVQKLKSESCSDRLYRTTKLSAESIAQQCKDADAKLAKQTAYNEKLDACRNEYMRTTKISSRQIDELCKNSLRPQKSKKTKAEPKKAASRRAECIPSDDENYMSCNGVLYKRDIQGAVIDALSKTLTETVYQDDHGAKPAGDGAAAAPARSE